MGNRSTLYGGGLSEKEALAHFNSEGWDGYKVKTLILNFLCCGLIVVAIGTVLEYVLQGIGARKVRNCCNAETQRPLPPPDQK